MPGTPTSYSNVLPQDLGIGRLFGAFRDAVIIAEASTGRILLWNPAATKIFGYSSSEVLGNSWTVIVPERLRAQCDAGMARYRDTGHGPYIDSQTVLELPAVRNDGEEITIEITLSAIEPSPNLEGADRRLVLAIVRDVTERKVVEQVVRESEERFRSLVEYTSDIITLLEADGTIRYISPAVERMTGYSPQQQIGTNAFDSVHPDDRERALAIFAEVLKHPGLQPPLEFRVPHKDGSWRYLEHVVNNLLDDPAVRGVVVTSRDVTERKRAEEEVRRLNESLEQRVAARTVRLERVLTDLERREQGLQESERLYRSVVEQAAENIFLVDTETKRILQTNAAFYKSLGYTEDELLQMTLYDVVAHDKESVDDNVRRILKEGHFYIGERRYRRKDGSLADVEVSVNAIPYRDRKAMCIVAHDITERKQTEKALLESERRFRQLFENSADVLFVHDEQGRIVDCNAQACRALGYARKELLKLTVADVAAHLITEEERLERSDETLWERAMRGEPGRIVGFEENELVRKDGTSFPVEVGVGAIDYEGRRLIFASARDLTARKGAEENLRQSLGVLLALREAGQVLGSTLESEEVVTRLLEIMRGVSSLTAAVISRQDEEGNLRIWRSAGLEALWPRARYAPEAESARRVALKEQENRLFRLRHPRSEDKHLVGLVLPLRVKHRVVGVLEAYGPEALGESDTVEILSSLASQAASALENAQLYEELEERERELQDLVGKLLEAQEEERRRVAYEVHDGLAQVAAAAHQHLQTFARRHAPSGERSRRDLERILGLVRGTVSDARRIIAYLRPTALDDLGLAAAISLEVEHLRKEGCRVDYEADLGDERLPHTVEIALFRVAQEALTNIRKHAQAEQVRIALHRQGETVRLEVRDSGRGFDPSAPYIKSGPGERVGLAGMRERVGMLGGKLVIHSQPGVGSSITATVPLTRAS